VAGSLAAQERGRTPAQFVVDDGHESIARLVIALAPRLQETADFVLGATHGRPGRIAAVATVIGCW
jgi:hypothetical protein